MYMYIFKHMNVSLRVSIFILHQALKFSDTERGGGEKETERDRERQRERERVHTRCLSRHGF